MTNSTKVLGVGAIALALLFCMGCGHDKNLDPLSDLVYSGPDPATQAIVVNPANTHLEYFDFHITLNDPNLSLLPKDAWTIDSCTGTFAISDPNGHNIAPLPAVNLTNATQVTSSSTTRYSITLVTQDWVAAPEVQSLVGTSDIVTVTLNATFKAHRNSDGLQKTIPVTWSFTLQGQ
jgi:hypothetical protein